MPGYFAGPVVSVVEWQRAQPKLLNSAQPFCADCVRAAGTGGAEKRMNMAKLVASEEVSTAVPASCVLVPSSGDPLKTQPAVAERSFTNASFETPCSTL